VKTRKEERKKEGKKNNVRYWIKYSQMCSIILLEDQKANDI